MGKLMLQAQNKSIVAVAHILLQPHLTSSSSPVASSLATSSSSSEPALSSPAKETE